MGLVTSCCLLRGVSEYEGTTLLAFLGLASSRPSLPDGNNQSLEERKIFFSPILALGASCGTGLSPRSAIIFLPCPMITVLVSPAGTKLSKSRVRSTKTRVLPCWQSSWLMSSHPPSPQPTAAHLVTSYPSPCSPFPFPFLVPGKCNNQLTANFSPSAHLKWLPFHPPPLHDSTRSSN